MKMKQHLNDRMQLVQKNYLTDSKNGLQNADYSEKRIDPYIYHRIFGYSIGAIVHGGNVLFMALSLRGPIMKDPDVEYFYSMKFIYCTIWNLIFQLIYIGIGIACDLPILLNIPDYKLLKWLRSYRTMFYNGVLWPYGWTIFSIFWPFYVYDRNLLFPEYIDKALSQVSNYIIHMFIAFPIIWDLFFLPNERPKTLKYTLAHMICINMLYLIVFFEHYNQQGKWPYPVCKMIYGTIYFPITITAIMITVLILYLIQWPIISLIWRNKSKST